MKILVNAKELSSQEKKKARAEISLVYGIHDTPFGKCLVGICEEGICHISFFQSDPEIHTEKFKEDVEKSSETEGMTQKTAEALKAIFTSGEKQKPPTSGTASRNYSFSFSVWEKAAWKPKRERPCLTRISRTRSGDPAAVRAVSNAVAGNPVAYLVPCHRVIGKTGDLHGYRWGLDVKSAILQLRRS